MKKIAIYTAIVGAYDEIHQPDVVDERFDYIIFSDDIREERIGVWQVRPINYTNSVQTKIARYVKTHPEYYLPEYRASLWIDANLIIKTDYVYTRLMELFKNQVLISSAAHPDIDCIYEELLSMLDCNYEREAIMVDWGHKLRKEGFPRHFGLFETGLTYRLHSDFRVQLFDQEWWHCIEQYSRRDQLSQMYVLWKLRDTIIKIVPFLPEGEFLVNQTSQFQYLPHQNAQTKYTYCSGKYEAWLWRYYHKHPECKDNVLNAYYWVYGRNLPHLWSFMLGQLYRIRDIISRLKC